MRISIVLKSGVIIPTSVEEYKCIEDAQRDFKKRLRYQNNEELHGALSTNDSIIKWSEIAAITKAI